VDDAALGESTGRTALEPPSPAVPPRQYQNARWKVQSDMAIAELQDALSANEGKLDTATVRIVRENLAIIDRAIGQAQHALRRDPKQRVPERTFGKHHATEDRAAAVRQRARIQPELERKSTTC